MYNTLYIHTRSKVLTGTLLLDSMYNLNQYTVFTALLENNGCRHNTRTTTRSAHSEVHQLDSYANDLKNTYSVRVCKINKQINK